MPVEELPQARKTEGVAKVRRIEIGFAIAFAGQGEHRVGAGLDAAFDEPCKMNAQEGKLRIGHGIDQVAHEELALRFDFEILAAEGDDADLAFLARQLRHAVAVQSGAIDHVIRLPVAGGGLHDPVGGAFRAGR